MTHGKGNMRTRKEKGKRKKETYLKLGLIKKYRTGGKHIPLVLRLQKKIEDKNKEMSQQVYGVSHKKRPITK